MTAPERPLGPRLRERLESLETHPLETAAEVLAGLFDAAENDYFVAAPAAAALERLYTVLAEAADLVEEELRRRRQTAEI